MIPVIVRSATISSFGSDLLLGDRLPPYRLKKQEELDSMKNSSRRSFLRASALASAGLAAPGFHISLSNPTDIRIEDLTFGYEEFLYRAPYKFGGVPVDRATILN